tara:strand:- start:37873 stop:38268 length:396 start_codon:yes stop_codon:yes gene_type:complete
MMQIVLAVRTTKVNKATFYVEHRFMMKEFHWINNEHVNEAIQSPTVTTQFKTEDARIKTPNWLDAVIDTLKLDAMTERQQVRCINPDSPTQYAVYAPMLTPETESDGQPPALDQWKYWLISIDLLQTNNPV